MSCAICLSALSDPVILECQHSFCLGCIQEHLKVAIQARKSKIICPQCPREVDDWLIELLVPHLAGQYRDNQLEKILAQQFTLFYCPNQACRNVVAVDNPNVRHVQCPGCQKEYCFSCQVEWHPNTTCAKYQEWARENKNADALTFQMLQQNAKRCPKCRTWIEKNQGCDHMTCSKPGCGHAFWWTTLEPWPHGKSTWEPSEADLERARNAPRVEVVAPLGQPTVLLSRQEFRQHVMGLPSSPARRPSPPISPVDLTDFSWESDEEIKVPVPPQVPVKPPQRPPQVPVKPPQRPPQVPVRPPQRPTQVPVPVRSDQAKIDQILDLFQSLSSDDQKKALTALKLNQNYDFPPLPLTNEKLSKLTVIHLQALCRQKKLPHSGTKSILIERLLK